MGSTPNTSGDDESGDEEDSEGGMTEIRFVPDDASSLDSMFTAMSECQQLHPDTDDSVSEAVEEGRRAWTPNSTTQSTVTRTSATPTSTTQHQWNNRYLGNEKLNSWLVSSAIQLSIYT